MSEQKLREALQEVEAELTELVIEAFKNDRDRTFDIYDAPDDAEACIVVTPKIYRKLREALLTRPEAQGEDDDAIRKAIDRIDRAGYYDEATLLNQVWQASDNWKRKCEAAWAVNKTTPPAATDVIKRVQRRIQHVMADAKRLPKVNLFVSDVEHLLACAAPQSGKKEDGPQLPEFDDLPDDVREEMEMVLYTTVSDEDHFGSEVAERIYGIVREVMLKRRLLLRQEWVKNVTSSDEDEPSVLGVPTPPSPPSKAEGEA